MTLSIQIFDPNDKPFGCLSNNFKNMKYDRSLGDCQTVTNYIYSNCLTNRINKQLMCKVKTDFKTFFLKKHQEEIESKIRSSILTALKVKFSNPELAKLLLETGTAPLLYMSTNSFLGNGERGDGDNWYGKSLEQIRLELINEEKKHKTKLAEKEKDKFVYNTWRAHKNLMNAIKTKDNNLEAFLHSTIDEINKTLGDTGANIALDKFLEQYRKGAFKHITPFVDNPETLVHEIRRQEMSGLRERMIRKKKKIIFNMYADYLLSRKFEHVPEKDYEKAKNEEFSGNDYFSEATDLEDRLYTLYEKEMLSASLSDKIDETFKDYLMPTEEDVEKAIDYDISLLAMSAPSMGDASLTSSKEESKLIYLTLLPENTEENRKLHKLSPIFYDGTMLKIELLLFPTVTHYISAKLIQHVSGLSLQQSQSLLLLKPDQKNPKNFVTPYNASDIYDDIKHKSYEENIIKFAKKGLDIKFQNRVFQDFLLATGSSHLVYNDFSDPVLGVGKGKGKNIVGYYLMELRERIKNERKTEELHMLTTGDITWIFENNNFMKGWIQNRVKDSCNTMKIMKNYLKEKHKIEGSFTPEFTRIVIDRIYQPCSQIYGAVKEITAVVPEYFNQMVLQACDAKISSAVVDILWKRLAVIIYYLIEHMNKTNKNIGNITSEIGFIQNFASTDTTCEKIISNENDNCIVSALINLLRRIVQFNNQISKENKDITEVDVNCATSIILNTLSTNFKQKSKPKLDDKKSSKMFSEEVGEEVGEEVIEKKDDGEEVEGEDFFDDGDIEEDEEDDEEKDEDEDYGDGDEDDDDHSPHTISQISKVLAEIEEVKDPETIAHAIEEAVKIINENSWHISKQVKKNRINFFATHR